MGAGSMRTYSVPYGIIGTRKKTVGTAAVSHGYETGAEDQDSKRDLIINQQVRRLQTMNPARTTRILNSKASMLEQMHPEITLDQRRVQVPAKESDRRVLQT